MTHRGRTSGAEGTGDSPSMGRSLDRSLCYIYSAGTLKTSFPGLFQL